MRSPRRAGFVLRTPLPPRPRCTCLLAANCLLRANSRPRCSSLVRRCWSACARSSATTTVPGRPPRPLPPTASPILPDPTRAPEPPTSSSPPPPSSATESPPRPKCPQQVTLLSASSRVACSSLIPPPLLLLLLLCLSSRAGQESLYGEGEAGDSLVNPDSPSSTEACRSASAPADSVSHAPWLVASGSTSPSHPSNASWISASTCFWFVPYIRCHVRGVGKQRAIVGLVAHQGAWLVAV